MSDLVNIVVYGAAGRMGQAVVRSVLESKRAQLSAALVRPRSGLADEPLDRVFGALPRDVDFATSLDPDVPCDVLVDFSGPIALDAALALAVQRRAAFVSGTTGLHDAQRAALDSAARTIPVLWASNFSLGVAMLARMARRVAEALPDWDCEIVELHHSRKQDAPSGTALMLGAAVAEGRKIALHEHARYERHGQIGARPPDEIGFATLRGGDVAGEHTVFFASEGERIELMHRATNRDIFARGALAAAIWLAGREPGTYSFDQVLAPKDTI
ncbi:MAG: 4-hydroxy-tetrahydrodipicolinate reductase [Proteobacteria bacterium]|uniref:4-hydroxy-tetrahydrodipicolinate reductase n=1 Tax=Rudaea sp. TaxID=2136325 RepID=UPI0032203F45|nr:4-hydroxy-tetrahydrodipicolinate reductase [Pseudomonadota bacterium]